MPSDAKRVLSSVGSKSANLASPRRRTRAEFGFIGQVQCFHHPFHDCVRAEDLNFSPGLHWYRLLSSHQRHCCRSSRICCEYQSWTRAVSGIFRLGDAKPCSCSNNSCAAEQCNDHQRRCMQQMLILGAAHAISLLHRREARPVRSPR